MAKLICEICNRKCFGDVLRTGDKYFHKKCFNCSECSKSLETGGFFVKNGKLYCHMDYQKQFSAKCKVCSKDLAGEIVTVLNYSFHRNCFKCSRCSLNFNPGDRVTAWKEQFFCPKCIKSQITSYQIRDDALPSPMSVTDDEGCISAPDASPSDFVSPNYASSKLVRLESDEKLRLTSPESKCLSSSGNPQKSKSILRKTLEDYPTNPSHERGYLSTDSGLGERLFDSRNHEEVSQVSIPEQSRGQTASNRLLATPSTTLSANLSHQSYDNLSHPAISQLAHPCKKADPTTAVNKYTQPKHFHIPEAKSRFLPPGTRTSSLLFGNTEMTTFPHAATPIRTTASGRLYLPKHTTNSAIELSSNANGFVKSPAQHDESGQGEYDVTMEARRLACYPSGHARDKNLPAPIERYDWPAPPSTAVVLAELMRERRCRRREQTRLSGTAGADGDEFQSQEILSIDDSFDGIGAENSGIARAISREEAESKRRYHSQFLDPVSASRSPNAAFEPSYKTRYNTHQFACQHLRPGYTGGRLSNLDKTSSLPGSSFVNYGRSEATSWQAPSISKDTENSTDNKAKLTSDPRKSYYHSVHTLSSPRFADPDPLRPATSSSRVPPCDMHQCNGDQLTYPNVHYTPPPSAAFHKCPPPAPKLIPYDQLKNFRGKTPKGIDRTALETHLSEEEFQNVFRLSRSAFYHLPEWKRNDLKKRVELY